MATALTLARRRRAALTATLITGAVALVFVVQQAPQAISAGAPGVGGPAAGPVSTVQERGEAAADGRITAADGHIAAGDPLGLFDGSPALANLDAELLEALRDAGAEAAAQGVELRVNGGWRSAELQERLLQDAVAKYGSAEEARRWVASPEESEHVSGDAVDVGPWEAADWLGRNGAGYGLCRIYENEPWHFELRPEAETAGCPPMYRDPTERER